MGDWRRYDDLMIGEGFPERPSRFLVTEQVACAFRELPVRSRVDAPSETSGLDPVPPMLAAVYIRGAQKALKGPPGGIHAKQRFAFLREIHVGDVLETTLTIKEKYEKKGQNYVICETRTSNQNGVEVTIGEVVSIWGREQ
jgi:3-hydroxybutyryl-CoA dehydratase